MAVFTKGNFSINLGFVTLGGELDDSDRQIAWALFTEIATRVAVSGHPGKPDIFDGELYVDSLNSLYAFLVEARGLMRQFPVTSLRRREKSNHLGVLIFRMIRDVLRPFLEKWHVSYRFWWEAKSEVDFHPLERQSEYPKLKEMLSDWKHVRQIMQKIQSEIQDAYKLVKI